MVSPRRVLPAYKAWGGFGGTDLMAWTRVDAGKSGVSSIALTVAIALPFVSLSFAGLSIEARAQTVTIDTAVVVSTTVNAGETLIVEDSGSIIVPVVVPAADAVVGSGAGARTIVNSGTITSTGNGLSGTAISFEDGGASLTLTNSGFITSLKDIGVDVLTLTDLNNSGTITAFGRAIDAGTIGNLTNSGTVKASVGIHVDTDIGSLVNSGAITGTAGHGISSLPPEVLLAAWSTVAPSQATLFLRASFSEVQFPA